MEIILPLLPTSMRFLADSYMLIEKKRRATHTLHDTSAFGKLMQSEACSAETLHRFCTRELIGGICRCLVFQCNSWCPTSDINLPVACSGIAPSLPSTSKSPLRYTRESNPKTRHTTRTTMNPGLKHWFRLTWTTWR